MAFIYNLTDSWNNAATTWNGIKLAVTNTSSDASSNLLNLTVSGATTASFVVDKSGNLTLNGTVNKVTFTPPATGATLTLADGSTFVTSGAHSTTLTTTGTTTLTLPTSGTVTALGNTTTGTGDIVLANSPTLSAPALGTPTSGDLSNCTNIPAGQLTGLGAGVGTWLATPTSANLRTAVTDETGTGALVFANSPALVTPNLGTPSAAILTNATGLPISTGVDGLGSGIATFLATPTSANLASAVTGETGSGALVFGTSPTIASPTVTGTATFNGSTSGSVTLRAPAVAGSTTFQLPASNGTSGFVLVTDGLGNTSWAASGGAAGNAAGVNKNVQFNDGGVMAGDAAFNFDMASNTLSLGVASTLTGNFELYNSASANAITIASGNNTAAWTLTLPTSAGTNGYVLTTDGTGATSWAAVTGTGDVSGPASSTDNAVVRFDGTTGKLVQNSAVTIADTTGDITGGKYNGLTVSPTTGTLTVANGKTLATDNSVTFVGTDGSTVTYGTGGTIAYTNSPVFDDDITVGVAASATGAVKFVGTTSGLVTLSVADAAGTWTFKLPTTAGSSGQALTTDGSGNATWTTITGGATGGGSDAIFWNNGQTVTTNYTVPASTNSGSFGPITINSGVTVTVSSGSTWTVV